MLPRPFSSCPYSPECPEGVFSEVYIQHSPGPIRYASPGQRWGVSSPYYTAIGTSSAAVLA
jgi:hypothetical protein